MNVYEKKDEHLLNRSDILIVKENLCIEILFADHIQRII